jgi:bud site selection protein 20
MGGPQRRKGSNAKNKQYKKAVRTRRRTKDLDQIHEEVLLARAGQLPRIEPDPDLPGMGQFRCIPCAKFFVSDKVLQEHTRSKVHKKQFVAF